LLFYDLDDETGQEELSVTISNNLIIGENNLTYTTKEWEDPDNPGDHYMAWLGEPYFVIQSGPDWYISKVLIDEDEDDVRTLNEGQSLTLPEGFVLTATEIEGFGGKANFIVTQDGKQVGSIVVNQGEQFKYETDLNRNGEDDNWVLRFNVEGVHEGVIRNFVWINDIDMISLKVLSGSDILDIGEDYFVNTAIPSTIKIENDNNIILTKDGYTGILDDRFDIRVNKPGTMAAISKDIEVIALGLIGQNEFYEILCVINTTTENEYFTFSANSYDNPCLLYFDLDDENGKEEISIIAGVGAGDELIIGKNNLAYTTMEWEDPDIPGDHYIAWLGEPYFVIQSGPEWYISELLVDEDKNDDHVLRVGESLTLPNGFSITAIEIDVDGQEVWFEVIYDGELVKSRVVDDDEEFRYETDLNESGNNDNWVLKFNVESVFAGMNTNLVKINNTKLIDPDVLKVESGPHYTIEGYSVDTAIPSTIKIENYYGIILERDDFTPILDDRFRIRVNKHGTMAAISRLITEPGTHELIGAVEYLDEAIDSPPASVTNLHNITYTPTYINWTWTDPEDADFEKVMVYLDQVFKTNVSKGVQYYNATGLTPATTYTISTKTVDSTGNINQTPVDNTSTTAPPLDIEQPAGVTNLKNVSYAPTYINWTWTDPEDADFEKVMVYLDQVFKTNVSKGVQYYNATGLTPATTYTISTKTVDSTGNINQTPVDNTSRTAPPLDIEPINITITSPANNSINTTGDVNVTVVLDRAGTALLNWNGVTESMNGSGTNFFKLQEDLFSGNFNFKVYAIDSKGVSSVSETRILTVNRTKTINLSIDPETGNVSKKIISIAPSENVTLTIFNGTNVSGCDKNVTEISIDSPDQLNPTLEKNLSNEELFLHENFSALPNCSRFNPDIQLQF
ncbi:MAG: S-layer protein/S-layer protein, partial [Candidatus Methanocomedens sp.]